ncbi:MFS transporter [Sphingobium sp. BS19]|uniref:spinster family MFS transporter n=1 Tax=Sphingobium sp. BS19 TaxID=3018973 RepID=UPI0022ED60E7|nr:MFS transporter [Sphingobium sp. BS19]GLI97370.1 MFS transporter [Sphingobium sp. BS19]
MTNTLTEPSTTTNAYRWYVVMLLTLAYVFSFIDRQILSLLIEEIKADLAISDTQFSLLSGLAFSLFYAIMGLPIAYFADRFSRVRIIAAGIAFWSLATVACGLARNFAHMFVARVGVGVGEAALTPATYSMLSDMFPREKLGRALGTYSMGAFLGGGLAFLVGGYVIALLKSTPLVDVGLLGTIRSWQFTFFIVGIPGLLIALAVLMTIRDPRSQAVVSTAHSPAIGDGLRFVRAHAGTFFFLFIGFSFFAMCQYALMNWTPALYIRKFGLSATQTGYLLGSILLVCSTSGAFCGGWLIDFLQKRGRTDAAMLSGIIGAAFMLPSAVGAALANNLQLSVALLVPAMFFSSFPLSTSAASIQVLAPKHLRAQIASFFLLVSNIIGMGIGTTLVALVTDRYFQDDRAVDSSLAIVIGVAATACLLLLGFGRRYYRASLAASVSRGS